MIFVNGCFWHRHEGCALARLPKSRLDFWIPKLEGNRLRDLANRAKLESMGWKTMTVWECQVKDEDALLACVKDFLDADG